MDERQHAINVATEILASADALEPRAAAHLIITTAELRGLLEVAQVAQATRDDILHHAFHEHGAAKVAALSAAWAPAARCPQCGGRAVPIVYGMPTAALGDLADLGVLELAGCVIEVDQPDFRCARCGEGWVQPD